MKRIVLTLLASLSIISVGAFAQTKPATKAPAPKATASAVQKITVKVDGTYSPALVTVKAGKPVEITFIKGKNVGCGGTVVFKSLGITKELKAEKTVVAFTPKKAGSIAFTCPMGMYEGSVTVK